MTESNDVSYPVMVDLETIGTKQHATIVQIGLVAFHPTEVGNLKKKLSLIVDIDQKRRIDPATLKWWMKTNSELFTKLVLEPGNKIDEAFVKVNQFCKEVGACEIWANSPSFDVDILRDAYEQYNMAFPLSFRVERDYRTLVAEANLELSEVKEECYKLGIVGTLHNALDDAVFQAVGVQLARKKLRGK